jgi:hypothetical protein
MRSHIETSRYALALCTVVLARCGSPIIIEPYYDGKAFRVRAKHVC